MADDMCSWLEDYRDGDLSAHERQIFADHLERCDICRTAVEENDRLDELVGRGVLQCSTIPAGLVGDIEERLRSAGRRRAACWSGGVAATVAIGLGLAMWLSTPASKRVVDLPVVKAAPAPAPTPAPAPSSEVEQRHGLVQVTSTSEDLVAVPVKTRDPSITIIWLYPNRKALTLQE